jgi:uracil phosphoribosyltransferase
MTPMRDAGVAGPALRAAHGNVGWYLASEFVTDMIGLEEYAIPHVQGHQTNGHRLHHEQQTAIVALMRGGEPMALGVSSAFPLAMLVHATKPSDIKFHHLQKWHNVLLVDSVINSGKSLVEFIQHIAVWVLPLSASLLLQGPSRRSRCQKDPSLKPLSKI